MENDGKKIVGEKEVYTFEKVVYLYLVNKKKYLTYSVLKFDELVELKKQQIDKKNIYDEFKIQYKNEANKFSDILDIFQIKDFFAVCKKTKGGYQFDKDGAEFISELLYRYSQKGVWREIRHVKNENFDGFIQIYRGPHGRSLLSELKFAIDGFLDIYEKHVKKDSQKYMDFKNALFISTQYNRLIWIQEMENIMFSAIPITMEEVYQTRCGVLLQDYEEQLYEVQQRIKEVIEIENSEWDLIKNYRTLEAEHCVVGDEIDDVMQHLIAEMKKHDLVAGEVYEDTYYQAEIRHPVKPGSVQERKQQDKVNKVFKRAFDELSEEEKRVVYLATVGNVNDQDNDVISKLDEAIK